MSKPVVTAKVTKTFPGVPDGETQVRDVKVGEVITGDLAKVAIGQGWAEIAADHAPADNASDNLEGMTVAELKALASDRNIDLGDATKKADIIAAIESGSRK